MDAVANPIYDWGDVAGRAFRMASRLTGRRRVLVPRTMSPMRLAEARTLCQPEVMPTHVRIDPVDYDPGTGRLDLADLEGKLGGDDVAAVYWESPGYLGFIESQGAEIVRLAHRHGALAINGVDPISLGVLTPPGRIGADIAVGDIQPLGIHMNAGGGCSGFLAFNDDPRYAEECPLELYTLLETDTPGEYAVAEAMAERTSYGARDQGKDWVGTASGLWTIAAAVYMSLMGPQGFRELGETCIARSHYAAKLLGEVPGVAIGLSSAFFKEFVVNFDGAGVTAASVNAGLLEKGIFGGKDLSVEFPELGQSALYCVTEYHDKEAVERLVTAVAEVVT
jgi:glycine dehydrogenase subunit 1